MMPIQNDQRLRLSASWSINPRITCAAFIKKTSGSLRALPAIISHENLEGSSLNQTSSCVFSLVWNKYFQWLSEYTHKNMFFWQSSCGDYAYKHMILGLFAQVLRYLSVIFLLPPQKKLEEKGNLFMALTGLTDSIKKYSTDTISFFF